MGRIAKVLSFFRSERHGTKVSGAIVDPGGRPNVTGDHFSNVGDDSYPLPGDYVAIVADAGTGREMVVGYLDPQNGQKSGLGEKRIYARDTDGNAVVEAWLKNDGEAHIFNDSGYWKLLPSGAVEVNGLTITTGGDIITASGISLDEHIHSQGNDGDGDGEADTDPPSMPEES